jgi:hypothetical protein
VRSSERLLTLKPTHKTAHSHYLAAILSFNSSYNLSTCGISIPAAFAWRTVLAAEHAGADDGDASSVFFDHRCH